ncbi:MAG: D-2-hydroxyacid dehydrogenase [Chloroflexi bacterium]|nr:D-2-hydroxyacid dehydrogenase [Chloroflexota bacterium]
MKVLIGPNFMGLEKGIPDLQTRFPQYEFVYCPDRAKLAEEIADAEIYVGWMNRDLFLAAKKLRWVQSPSTGINYYLDIPEFVASDVLLTSARGTHAACLAESAFAMILAFTREIRRFILAQLEHRWVGRELRHEMTELTGTTLGIIGFGAVGRAIAERAKAFGLNILAVDLYPGDKPDYVAELWGVDRLEDLMAQSDYVVVTVPYTPDTDGMIGAAQIGHMKKNAILVGISRGKIIDEAALVDALRNGRLRGAALDVFAQEPLPPDSELWDVPNLLITPHAAGGTQYEGRYVLDILTENLERFLKGDLPLRNQIDKKRGF